MAIHATSEIFIEPDNQYTTVTVYTDTDAGGRVLLAPGQNQTIIVAFNKLRDDLASLVTGGKVVKSVITKVRIE